MTVKISKPAINLREELASLRNQGGLPKEDKLYVGELITNGTFDNGTTGWYVSSSGMALTVVNGEVNLTNSAGSGKGTSQGFKTEIGKTYKITATARVVSGNGAFLVAAVANVQFSNNLGVDSTTSSSNTELSVTFTAVDEESYVYLRSDLSGVVIFDNVTVQEVGENLVTGFTNGTTYAYDTLTTSGTSVTSAITDGSDFAGMASNPLTYKTGETYTVSFKLTLNSGDLPEVMIVHNANGGSTVRSNIVVATTGFNEFTLTTTTYGTLYLQIRNTNGESSNYSIDNVVFTKGSHPVIQSIPHGYDVKDVYINGELAREGEAYDYTFLNGSIKPTVEPTATTETVVIGVRK